MTVNQILTEIDRHRARFPMKVGVLSEKAGLSRNAYVQWMNGACKPQLQTLVNVCDVLGLELCIREKERTV